MIDWLGLFILFIFIFLNLFIKYILFLHQYTDHSCL